MKRITINMNVFLLASVTSSLLVCCADGGQPQSTGVVSTQGAPDVPPELAAAMRWEEGHPLELAARREAEAHLPAYPNEEPDELCEIDHSARGDAVGPQVALAPIPARSDSEENPPTLDDLSLAVVLDGRNVPSPPGDLAWRLERLQTEAARLPASRSAAERNERYHRLKEAIFEAD